MLREKRDEELNNAMHLYGEYLTRLAFTYVRDKAIAEDIVQEVFVRFYTKMEQFNDQSSLKTYLYRITVNTCHNHLRSWKNKHVIFTDILGKILLSKKTPEQSVIERERKFELAESVSRLPIKYKDVILLHYYSQLSITEISSILQCPEGTVKTRLARGRKKLEQMLVKEGIHGV